MCKKVELTYDDMEFMTVGMCLDYIDEFIDQNSTNKEKPTRKATQEDFDNF